MRFTSLNDVDMRMHDTVLYYKTRPVYLFAHQGDYKVRIRDLVTGAKQTISVDDEELSMVTPTAGYVNFTYYTEGADDDKVHRAGLLRRHSIRQFRQGLSSSNCSCLDPGTGTNYPNNWPFKLEDLGHSLLDNFPSAYDAWRRIVSSEETDSIAFSRDLAFVKVDEGQLYLYHQRDLIGLLDITQAHPTAVLLPEYDNNPTLKDTLLRYGVKLW